MKYGRDANRSSSVSPGANPERPDGGFGARLRALVVGAPGTFDGADVTRAIIWVNVLVFVAQLAMAHSRSALLLIPGRLMVLFGANIAPATLFDHRFETLVTSCFLHFSILHIGFNMIALRQVGPFVERVAGPGRFAMMYLASGIAGSIGSALYWLARHDASDVRLSAGASGAVCGGIGAAMILGARIEGWRGPIAQGMARWLGSVFILGLVVSGVVDNAAHAGGALGGAIIAALWRRGVTQSAGMQRVALVFAAAICVISGLVVVGRDLFDPYITLDSQGRYDRTVADLSARRCGDAHHGLRTLETMPIDIEGTAEDRQLFLLKVRALHIAVDAHCSD